MRVFRNRAAAEAADFAVSAHSPTIAASNTSGERAIVRTDLEAQLAEALEAVQRLAGHCPCCGQMRNRDHAPDCKLSLALKAFRGETP